MSRIRTTTAALALLLALLAGCTPSSTEVGADEPEATTPAPSAPDSSEPESGDPESGDPEPGDPESGDPESGDSDSPSEPLDLNDPTAGPDRESNEPRQVPLLQLPATAPGTDEAAAALLQDLDRFLTQEQREQGVPWPDLRNADPVASYQSDARFQNWMSQNNPTPTLVEAYTAPGSPERGFDLELFGRQNDLDLRSGPSDPPYSMRVDDLVHPAATGITDALLAQVPQGSAAIVYWDSAGPSDMFTSDGQYFSSNSGWSEEGPWVAIMAPTDVGWQVWWDELTDPPPPGSRQQGGTPQETPPRRDL